MTNTKKQKNILKINIWLGGIIGFIILIAISVNFIILGKTNNSLDKKIAEAKEAARPAELEIILIKDSTCSDCAQVEPTIEVIKKENVIVKSGKSIEAGSSEAQTLIKKYNILKLPSFIISGEVEKEPALKNLWPQIGAIQDNTFIFRLTQAPFIDTKTNEIKGRVEMTLLYDETCGECYNVQNNLGALSRFGLPTKNNKIIDVNSQEGQELIQKYNLKLAPTVIISGDPEPYSALKQIWSQVGTIENDGSYILRKGVAQMGTYKNLEDNQVIDPRAKKAQK